MFRLATGFEVGELCSFSGSCDAMHLLQEAWLICNRARLSAVAGVALLCRCHRVGASSAGSRGRGVR